MALAAEVDKTKPCPASRDGSYNFGCIKVSVSGFGVIYIDMTPQLGGDRTLQSTPLGEYHFARSSVPGASKGSSFALVCANDV